MHVVSVPEGAYPASGGASPCAPLPPLIAGLAGAEPQPHAAFAAGRLRGGPGQTPGSRTFVHQVAFKHPINPAGSEGFLESG